jgi:hypothetical protein
MVVGVHNWSVTAGANATADSNVNWSEGQLAPTVNNSARAMMAAQKAYSNTISGGITFGGAGNAYTATNDAVGAWSAYGAGLLIALKANHTNSGAATINVDGLGAKSIVTADGGALIAGDIVSGGIYMLAYDGTNMQVLNQLAGGSFQPLDATLTALAALSGSAGQMLYWTGTDTFSLITTTTAGRALLDDADASAQRTTLGFATLTDYVTLTGSQTLTNKSLTSPSLSGTVAGGVTFSTATQIFGTGTDVAGMTGTAGPRVQVTGVTAGLAVRRDGFAEVGLQSGGFGGLVGTWSNHPLGVFVNSAAHSTFDTAGTLSVGGVVVPTISSTSTLTNKTLTSPTVGGTVTASGTVTMSGQFNFENPNSLVQSFGTAGYGAFLARGSGTNPAYMFFNNATTGELTRAYGTNAKSFIVSNDGGTTEHFRVNSAGVVAASNVTMPTISSTDTLTNKTLTSPTINGTVAGSPIYSGNPSYTSALTLMPQVLIRNTFTDATAGYLILDKVASDNSLTAGDALGALMFRGGDTLGGVRNAAYVQGTVRSQSAAFVGASLDFFTSVAASLDTIEGGFHGGMAIGAPSGTFKGVGTLNVQNAIYLNNVLVPTISSTSTLTNKTLTAPTISDPAITGQEIITSTSAGAQTTPTILRNANGTASTAVALQFNAAAFPTRYAEIASINDGSNNTSLVLRGGAGGTLTAGLTISGGGVPTLNTGANIGGVAIPTISSTDSLSNKTLASPTLSGTVSGAATWTGAQTFTTGGAANSTDLTIGNSQSIMKISGGDGTYTFIDSATWGVALRTQNVNRITITNAGAISFATVPTAGGVAIPTISSTDTLTNKTLTSPVISTIVNTGTLTLPTSTDTLVGRATTDTLTNKTLTSPTINGGTIQSRVQISGETTGTLTSASANKHLALTGGITMPNSVFTTGDMMTIDPGTVSRTVTRGAGIALYVNGVDVASCTIASNEMAGAHWRSASVCVMTGAVS